MNETKKPKAAPGTASSYDLELATMKSCKTLIMKNSTVEARQRILNYLTGVVIQAERSAPLQPPPNPRQPELPGTESAFG